MSTRTEAVLPPLISIDRRAPRAQARENSISVPSGGRMIVKRTASWDPYEVWRTRVKAPTTPSQE
jgi:hypothetical protein